MIQGPSFDLSMSRTNAVSCLHVDHRRLISQRPPLTHVTLPNNYMHQRMIVSLYEGFVRGEQSFEWGQGSFREAWALDACLRMGQVLWYPESPPPSSPLSPLPHPTGESTRAWRAQPQAHISRSTHL